MPIASINPYNNQLLQAFEPLSTEQIQQCLAKAENSFKHWKQTDFAYRAQMMNRVADVLEVNKAHYARLMAMEMGKVYSSAMAEVDKCALNCRFYADNAAIFLADEQIDTEAQKSLITYQPLGAVLAVMPWNFPFWQLFRFAAPALMAGNVALLKHASNVPQCAEAIADVFVQAGLPDGVFQNLLIGADQVGELIAHDTIKAVTLTGSETAGSKVAEAAGRYIKKTVLELGGSDAFIVLDDADIDWAATQAVKSRMINTGQSCIAAKRFIVVEPVADAFVEAMRFKMASLKGGDPMQAGMDYGPMARKDLAEELMQQVQKSIAMGAVAVLGGDRPNREGAFFNPTILTNVRRGMPAYDEELFGPVASIIVVKDEAEAIQVANDCRYGLGGSVWTRDVKRGEKVARAIEAGAVFVNAIVQSDPRMPFGGIKKSGYGRELSAVGIREFTNQQTLWIG